MGDDDRDDEHEEDRSAILSRRNRFIAIALSGLATGLTPASGCGDDTTGGATPRLDPVQMTPLQAPEPEPDPTGAVTPPEPPEPPAMMDPSPPRVCLRRVMPRMQPPPRPCLDFPAPQVCLEYIQEPFDEDDNGDGNG